MAIAATAVWEVRTTAAASNVNSGFFVPGASGVDYSQQDAAQFALTGVTSSGAGNVILTASAAATMVGNGINVISGTNFTVGRFEITAVDPGVSITCSTNRAGAAISTGVGADGVINIGGALVNLTDAALETVSAGNTIYVKAGTYTTGAISIGTGNGSALLPVKIVGYNATRTDMPTGDNRPLLDLAGNQATFGTQYHIRNFRMTSTNGNGCVAYTGNNSLMVNCKLISTAVSSTAYAVTMGSNTLLFDCHLVSNGIGVTGNTAAMSVIGCYVQGNTIGVNLAHAGNTATCINNLIVGFSDAGIRVPNSMTEYLLIMGNTIYTSDNTGTTGISLAAGATSPRMINNIIAGCENDTNFNSGAVLSVFADYNIYADSNSNVGVAGYAAGPHEQYDVALTFADAAGGNYKPSSLAVAAGFPGEFNGLTTTDGYMDVGAVQTQYGSGQAPGGSGRNHLGTIKIG